MGGNWCRPAEKPAFPLPGLFLLQSPKRNKCISKEEGLSGNICSKYSLCNKSLTND